MIEPDRPRPRPIVSKATRNERRKLAATLLNNLAAALLIAGLVQPVLAFLREGDPFRAMDYLAGLAFFVAGAIFHVAAQWVLGGLHD